MSPFSRSWLRAGVVQLDGEKMSKSTGNLVLAQDLLAQFSPAAVRLLCLNRDRDAPWSFTPALIEDAASVLEELYAAAAWPGPGASTALADALLTDIDVVGAVDVASSEGGTTARELIEVLALA